MINEKRFLLQFVKDLRLGQRSTFQQQVNEPKWREKKGLELSLQGIVSVSVSAC